MTVITYVLFLGSYYCLISVGVALVFGVMKLINFAHGEFYMLGAVIVWYVAYYLSASTNMSQLLIFLIGLIIGMILVSLLGIFIQRTLFTRLADSPFSAFMASYGLMYALHVAVSKIFGTKDRSISITPFEGSIRIFNADIPLQRIAVILISVIILLAFAYFLNKTRTGRAIRACSQDEIAASLQGIDAKRISMLVMAIGSALAAAAGGLIGSTLTVSAYMGENAIWLAFIFVIIGGLGNIKGVVLTSFSFALLHGMIQLAGLSTYQELINVVVMLIILSFKPEGVFGNES